MFELTAPLAALLVLQEENFKPQGGERQMAQLHIVISRLCPISAERCKVSKQSNQMPRLTSYTPVFEHSPLHVAVSGVWTDWRTELYKKERVELLTLLHICTELDNMLVKIGARKT